MMKVGLSMIVFKNYSRLGAGMHTANHPEGDTPRTKGSLMLDLFYPIVSTRFIFSAEYSAECSKILCSNMPRSCTIVSTFMWLGGYSAEYSGSAVLSHSAE